MSIIHSISRLVEAIEPYLAAKAGPRFRIIIEADLDAAYMISDRIKHEVRKHAGSITEDIMDKRPPLEGIKIMGIPVEVRGIMP